MYSYLQPLWLSVALIAAAMPTGINVYLFGLRYDTGSAPAATAILLSTRLLVVNVAVVLLFFGRVLAKFSEKMRFIICIEGGGDPYKCRKGRGWIWPSGNIV